MSGEARIELVPAEQLLRPQLYRGSSNIASAESDANRRGCDEDLEERVQLGDELRRTARSDDLQERRRFPHGQHRRPNGLNVSDGKRWHKRSTRIPCGTNAAGDVEGLAR